MVLLNLSCPRLDRSQFDVEIHRHRRMVAELLVFGEGSALAFQGHQGRDHGIQEAELAFLALWVTQIDLFTASGNLSR